MSRALWQISGYTSWIEMKRRCYNHWRKDYPRYGGNGIRVCDRWLSSPANFFADMGPRPPGCTLDRIDSTLNYSPDNCRWATALEQGRNRSVVVSDELRDEMLGLYSTGDYRQQDVADMCGVSKTTVQGILQVPGQRNKRHKRTYS